MDLFTDPKVEGQFWTPESREAAHVYIQEQIRTHESIIRYYKEHRNALTITCRIPQEVLATIFQEVLYHPEDVVEYSYQRLPKFKAVSHVCSHWRNVALSTPSLWTKILIYPSNWTKAIVQRSKMAPLSLTFAPYATMASSSFAMFRDILETSLPRIKNLTINYRRNCYQHDFEDRRRLLASLNQAAPIMERLEIDFYWYSSSSYSGDCNILPDGILVSLPKLREMKLSGGGLAWELASFRSLTCLEIRGIPPALRPSMAQLLCVLSQTPLLETLRINDIYTTYHSLVDGGTASHQRIDSIILANLKNINVSFPPSPCAFLFDHLILSKSLSSVTVALKTEPGDFDEPNTLILKRMVRYFTDHAEGDIAKLELDPELGVRVWLSKTPVYTFYYQETIHIHFNQHTTFLTNRFEGIFWQSLGLDNLISFVAKDVSLDAETWTFFGNLPMLHELWVNDANTVHLLDALRCGVAEKKASGEISGSDPPFPTLWTLTISEWNLDDDLGEPGSTLAERAGKCFELRKEAGFQLDELRLHRCSYVSPENLECLEKDIFKVDWDGEGDTEYYEPEEYADEASDSDRPYDFDPWLSPGGWWT